MLLDRLAYVPAVRWRQGEYQALLRLDPPVKDQITPLISIPPVEFDFELRVPKKSVHEHVHPFVARYHKKWRRRPAWVTLCDEIAAGRMNDGSHVFDYLFSGLRALDARAVPALPLNVDPDTVAAARKAIALDSQGAGVIVHLEDLMKGALRKRIDSLADGLSTKPDEVDLFIDLRTPNFQPYEDFADALVAALRQVGDFQDYRNLVLLSTAIPESFADIAKGSDEIPRHDWLFFKFLLGRIPSEMRKPIYGDYTTVHPDFTALDMRLVKAAAKIVYTTPESWATRKGTAFRDYPAQMHTHCAAIVNEDRFKFSGAQFSHGDRYIAACAAGLEGHSNLTRWKEVAINHHITMVTHDLARLAAAS